MQLTSDIALPSATPKASIVIAALNEVENVGLVVDELIKTFELSAPYELVIVDDGSIDGTGDRIAALMRLHPQIRLLRHDRRCGKSAALRTGIAAARGDWIATMDADGQNDPRDVLGLLQAAWAADGAPAPIVAGIRRDRMDTGSKRLGSRLANRLRRHVLGDSCPDTGCGLKAFRRDDFLCLPGFEGMHRFLPALFQMYGHRLICQPVGDRPRLAGRSNYTNLGRAMVGIGDLLGVLWLRSRTHRPGRVRES